MLTHCFSSFLLLESYIAFVLLARTYVKADRKLPMVVMTVHRQRKQHGDHGRGIVVREF